MSRKLWSIFGMLVILQLAACGSSQGDQIGKTGTNQAPQVTATSAVVGTGTGPILPQQIATVTVQATPTTPVPKPKQNPTPPSNPTTGTYGTPPLPTATENQLSQQLLALINQDRAAQSLSAYNLNTTLAIGARLHSWAMAHCGLTHACPNEPQACQRVLNEGIQYMACGENVGYTSPYPTAWGGVQTIERDMLNEPPPAGHRYNLLNTAYHRIGIGIYIDTKGFIWITEDFTN